MSVILAFTMGHVGRALRKTPPYDFVSNRLSRHITAPLSSFRRISRPNACLNLMQALGRLYAAKGFSPFFFSASALASANGSDGTSNGSFVIITDRKASPGMSTPSQNEAVAKRTEACVC